MELSSIPNLMKTLPGPTFAARLIQADVSQAAFARLTGISARQVNAWCRGHAVVPRWAAIIALMLPEFTPEMLTLMVEEAFVSPDEPIAALAAAKGFSPAAVIADAS